jgi:hypothetical protein
MAGHSKHKGQFFLPRSGIPVPPEIFPFASELTEWRKNSATLKAFFDLLVNLRDVICQDVAVMMNDDKSHILFNLPVCLCLI